MDKQDEGLLGFIEKAKRANLSQPTLINLRILPVGEGYIYQVFEAKSVSLGQMNMALYNLLEELKKGLPLGSPTTLFSVLVESVENDPAFLQLFANRPVKA